MGLAVCLLPALAGCSEQKGETPHKGPAPVAVRVAEVTKGPLSQAVFVEGTARAVRREYLYFQGAGRVVWVAPGPEGRELKEGDPVRKGQVLARLDARISNEDIKALKAALEQAKTQAGHARAELNRRSALLAKKAIAPATWQSYKQALDTAEAQVKAAEARLAQSKVQGSMIVLTAPMDGIVAYLNVKVGYYSMGANIQARSESDLLNLIPMVVVDPSRFEVTVRVPYFQSVDIKPGAPAVLGVGLAPTPEQEKAWAAYKPVAAKVFSVNPAIDPGSRHVAVRLRTTGDTKGLKDGMHMTGWVVTRQVDNAVLAPHEALVYRDGETFVWVVEGKGVKLARVSLGLYDDHQNQVLKGLAPGQRVVTDGRYLITPQSKVRVIGPVASPARTGKG